MNTTAALLAVQQAQEQLGQLEATAKGLIDELAAPGAQQPTPRLRELLASGERLVAAVTAAGGQLGGLLPVAGAALPPAPSHVAVEAVWAQQAEMERGPGPALLPTPVAQPATALPELAASLSTHLRGCRVQLLQGRQPTEDGSSATAVLLHCDRAFTAVVHLEQPGSLRPLRVGVLSIAEAAAATGGSGGPDASLWAPSRHAVYQTMSSQASAALQHFVQEQPPPQQQQQGSASALELQLLWLCTCSDVFSRKSGTSGLLLQADPAAPGGGLLPPLHRPWQGLGWAQLWQAALNPKLRRAEHVTEG